MLDLFLIAFAYYLAFVFRFDFHLDNDQLRMYLSSFPLILISTYSAFFFFGIYRGVWRYTGLEDLWSLAKGVISATALAAVAILLLYRFIGYSRVVFILYALLLFLGVAASRLSFRFFELLLARPQTYSPTVLIYGAGDAGEVVVRECRRNLKLGYRPVGFLDDDPCKHGRAILGLPVFGGVDDLTEILTQENIQGLIISSPSILVNGNAEKVRGLCRDKNLWVKRLRFEFIEEL